MTVRQRLEPSDVQLEGPSIRITSLADDPDVMLEFKSEENAAAAHQALRNYIEFVDVEPSDQSVMRMLELLLGDPDDADPAD